jgi:hypothetical protein
VHRISYGILAKNYEYCRAKEKPQLKRRGLFANFYEVGCDCGGVVGLVEANRHL